MVQSHGVGKPFKTFQDRRSMTQCWNVRFILLCHLIHMRSSRYVYQEIPNITTRYFMKLIMSLNRNINLKLNSDDPPICRNWLGLGSRNFFLSKINIIEKVLPDTGIISSHFIFEQNEIWIEMLKFFLWPSLAEKISSSGWNTGRKLLYIYLGLKLHLIVDHFEDRSSFGRGWFRQKKY